MDKDKSKIVIGYGRAWKCDNMDSLADIIWEGYEVLLADGTRKLVDDLDARDYRLATEAELRNFYRAEGHLFIDDEIEIIKGRKLPIGEHKIVSGFYEYNVPGTHGKMGTTYVTFTDGTRTSVENVRGIKSLPGKLTTRHFKYDLGGRK